MCMILHAFIKCLPILNLHISPNGNIFTPSIGGGTVPYVWVMGRSRIKFITRVMCSLPGPAGSFCAGGKAGLDTCEGKKYI